MNIKENLLKGLTLKNLLSELMTFVLGFFTALYFF